MSKAAELAALIGSGQAQGDKNLIINGAMQVAQRGTSSTASGGHSVDRYRVDFLNFDQLGVTQSQSTTVPSGKGFSNSLKVAVTTQETTLDANELFIIRQTIEAQNLQRLAYGTSSAKSLTLSFWVRSSLAGKYSVMFYSEDGNRSNTPSFTISSADTWEFVTITIDGDTAGTINNDNGKGLQVTWVLAAGTDWAGTPHTGWGAFVETDDYAFSDQVNFAAQTGEFYITGVSLEVGDVATPFEHESFAETLQKCQRYYVQYNAGGTAYKDFVNVSAFSTTNARGTMNMFVPMRAACTLSSSGAFQVLGLGTISSLSIVTAVSDIAQVTIDSTGTGYTVGNSGSLRSNNNSSSYIAFDAEL
tara:strand:+ start:331 stop:1410 length:1080 start_codon:yes stop_codon:yes gene_type:complete